MKLTKEQQSELHTMYKQAKEAMERYRKEARDNPQSLDQLFEYAPDGDFEWKDMEAGDWHVYCCDEKDCPLQWHKIAYYEEFGREGGKRWVYLGSVDEDGNSEHDIGFDEREGDKEADWHWIGVEMSMKIHEYFFGWFLYWAEAAQTGEDILGESFFPSPQEYFKYAKDNLNCLVK